MHAGHGITAASTFVRAGSGDPDRLPWLADEKVVASTGNMWKTAFVALFALIVIAAGTYAWRVPGPALVKEGPDQRGPAPLTAMTQTYGTLQETPTPLPPPHEASATPKPGTVEPAAAEAALTLPSPPRPAIKVLSSNKVEPDPAPARQLDLAPVDRHVGLLYSQSWRYADAGKRAVLLRTQRRFTARMAACPSPACKNDAYLARSREVSEIMSGRWKSRVPLPGEDPEIAKVDRQVALLYSQSWRHADVGRRARLLATHKRFLESLENCSTPQCGSNVYLARMGEISRIMLRPEQASIGTY